MSVRAVLPCFTQQDKSEGLKQTVPVRKTCIMEPDAPVCSIKTSADETVTG